MWCDYIVAVLFIACSYAFIDTVDMHPVPLNLDINNSFIYLERYKPKSLPYAKDNNVDRLISVNKTLHVIPENTNKIIVSSNATQLGGAKEISQVIFESNTHYTFNYFCIDQFTVFNEKNRFRSVFADLHDGSEVELAEEIYDEVIFLQCSYREFGHHIHDGLVSGIMALPAEIVKRSMIATRFNMDLSRRFIELLGIDHGPYLNLKPKTAYLCRKLHIIEPFYFMAAQYYHTKIAAAQIAKHMNLNAIKPEIGIFNNRKYDHPRGRHILNWNELFEAVKRKYSNETFINLLPNEIENISYSLKLFAAAKYFIVTCGSAPINALFMKPGTGVSMIGAQDYDWLTVAMCSILDIWVTYAANGNVIHFPHTRAQRCATVSVEYNLKYIDKMIYAVNNQKWPPLEASDCLLYDYKTLANKKGINTSTPTTFTYEQFQPD